MNAELTELLDSMVDGFIQDICHEFDLDKDEQAIKLIKQSLTKVENE